jgi:peptidyl-prolyl cis-trans isomerase B (cyclophilin B)
MRKTNNNQKKSKVPSSTDEPTSKLRLILRSIMVILAIGLIFMIYNQNNTNEENTMTQAIFKTNKGDITIELFTDKAPITTKNFIELIESKFYDGIIFHRVEPGFVIQVGDDLTKTLPIDDPSIGTGGSKKTIPLEVSPELKLSSAGVLSMARTMDPNSASSQFFITLDKTPHLDMQYAVFVNVTKGLDVVKKIRVGDKIISAELI